MPSNGKSQYVFCRNFGVGRTKVPTSRAGRGVSSAAKARGEPPQDGRGHGRERARSGPQRARHSDPRPSARRPRDQPTSSLRARQPGPASSVSFARNEGITRQEIEAGPDFGRAVVADRIATLIERGLVEEVRSGARPGAGRRATLGSGRRPATSSWRHSARRRSASASRTCRADCSSSTTRQADATLGAERTLDRVVPCSTGCSRSIPRRDRLGHRARRPGPRRAPGWPAERAGHPAPDAGLAASSRWPGTSASRFGARVWMDNEVHLMTLGEFYAGRASGYQRPVS